MHAKLSFGTLLISVLQPVIQWLAYAKACRRPSMNSVSSKICSPAVGFPRRALLLLLQDLLRYNNFTTYTMACPKPARRILTPGAPCCSGGRALVILVSRLITLTLSCSNHAVAAASNYICQAHAAPRAAATLTRSRKRTAVMHLRQPAHMKPAPHNNAVPFPAH